MSCLVINIQILHRHRKNFKRNPEKRIHELHMYDVLRQIGICRKLTGGKEFHLEILIL